MMILKMGKNQLRMRKWEESTLNSFYYKISG